MHIQNFHHFLVCFENRIFLVAMHYAFQVLESGIMIQLVNCPIPNLVVHVTNWPLWNSFLHRLVVVNSE